ncbi:hypothetical protein NLI96_g12101 [Meripilus lineatus]|uniref:Uncharacterized protein n=1 Tax=Meripilus lineatus TaxID=2056292 RepID=A0AAD5US68_9APHY|nr:hypothetical protein NLI96_g12101 [Physisporinus lineatus]
MLFLYASDLNTSHPATPPTHWQNCPFSSSNAKHKGPCGVRCVAGHLSRLPDSPSTPPRKSIARTMQKVRKKRELKQSRKINVMDIKRMDDGRRVPLQWMAEAGLPAFENLLKLIPIEEAQQREDVVYRGFHWTSLRLSRF